jgi:xylulokinase
LFLGIDIGTSGVKTVIVDETGIVRDTSQASLDVQRPKPLWSEQVPTDWWVATNQAVMGLDTKLRSGISSIGLAGQMHGATVLNADGKALRPAILWNDGRSSKECVDLENALPDLGVITGNRAMPGFTAPKLLWLKKHEPDTFKQISKVLLPKDYVRLRMTGEYATDMSDAAGTLWLNTKTREWSNKVLSACGLNNEHMPKLYEGPEITGQLRSELAQSWGMARVPVVAGGGDNAAGAIGSGVVHKGDGFLSLGTSGVIFLADDAYRPHPEGGIHTFCHALPNRWHQMSVMLSAASSIDWVAGICGFETPAQLYETAAKANTLSRQELFLPYLSGERTPHNDPIAQGVFFGLSHQTDATRLAQAALEGVAFGLSDGIRALKQSGADIKTLSVIGGGARSDYWGKILASVFDIPLIYRDGGTVGPAFGAAQLARLGVTGETIDDVCNPPPITNIIEPDASFRDHFGERLRLYRSLYPLLSESFKENQA